jgi:hypothetical protein
MGSK